MVFELMFNGAMLLFFIYCIFYMHQTTPKPIPNTMGSEVWPYFILGVLIVLIGANMLLIAAKNRKTSGPLKIEISAAKIIRSKMFLQIVMLVVYSLILDYIGFVFSTLILCGCSIALIGQKKKWVIAAGAVVITLVIFFMFSWGLMVPLPRGYGVFREFSLMLERV